MSGAARKWVFEVIEALFDFGRVTGTHRGSSTKSIAVDIEGNVDQEDRAETSREDLWGSAAMQYRPADPDGDGAAEVLYVRRGNELLPIATRDFRFQVDLEKGEVVVTNLDKTKPARIWLRADGTLTIEADEVRIGDAAAGSTIGLGDAIKGHFDAQKSWMDALTLPVTGTANLGTGAVTGTAGPPVSPSPTVPDVESRHKVEN